MKKKFLSFLLAICMMLPCLFALNACGDKSLDYLQFTLMDDGTYSVALKDEYRTVRKDDGIGVIDGANRWDLLEKTIKIPSTYEGKAVTKIADYGFYDATMKEIEISSGVTHIGEYAFSGAYQLKSFSLPDTVKFIDICAFSNVIDTTLYVETEFQYLVIPTSVEYIEDNAFDSDLELYYKGTTEQFSTIKEKYLINGEWVEYTYEGNSDEKWFFYSDDISDITDYISNERTVKGLWKYNAQNEIESVAITYGDTVSGKTFTYTNSTVELSNTYWQMLSDAKAQGWLEQTLDPAQVAMFNESANKEEFAAKQAAANATTLAGISVVFADGKMTMWQGETQLSQPFDYVEVNDSIYYKERVTYTLKYTLENGKLVEVRTSEYGDVAKDYYVAQA